MKLANAFVAAIPDQTSAPDPRHRHLHSISAAAPTIDWHRLSNAIDVVASLAEQAWRNSEKGACDPALFESLNSTFALMVRYLHHLAIDQLDPSQALVKAATAARELSAEEMDVIRAFSVTAQQ